MQKSTIQFLQISFFLILVLSSCATKIVNDYTPVTLEKTIYEAPYFSNSEMDYVYRAKINAYEHELSGIFIAKKISDTVFRVVFTTEFGNKLLDFEISENNFEVNSIVEELNRKMIINTLKKDFSLLLKYHYLISEQYENATEKIYKSNDDNQFNFLYVSKANEKLIKIVHASKAKEKISINFEAKNNFFAERIIIKHQDIKLKIELNYFKPTNQ